MWQDKLNYVLLSQYSTVIGPIPLYDFLQLQFQSKKPVRVIDYTPKVEEIATWEHNPHLLRA